MTGFHARQYIIPTLLRDIDPQRTDSRRRHRLRKKVYTNHGPNYAWHIDGHDKLNPFGFAIHGAIDGYSREVLWGYLGGIYLDYVKEMEGFPIK